METSQVLALGVVATLAFILPPQSLLIIALFPLTILSDGFQLLPSLAQIGDAEIRFSDGLLLAVGIKTLFLVLSRRRNIHWHAAYLPLLTFVGLLFVATLVAFVDFGNSIFRAEMVSLVRMLANVSVLFLFVISMGPRQPTVSFKLLDALGYLVAASVFINLGLESFGISIGEVQTGGQTARYFGLIGDQVGYLLPFFAFLKVLERKFVMALLFVGAIYVTGTRSALAVLAVGVVALAWERREGIGLTRAKFAACVLLLGVFLSFLVVQDLGGLSLRYSPGQILSSLEDRLASARVALQVFGDRPWWGIGFSGFRFLAWEYVEGDQIARTVATQRTTMSTAQNQYLQVLADGGLPAFFAFIWMSVVFLRTFRRGATTAGREGSIVASAGFVWLLALLVGNQTAVWFLPGSLITLQLWLVLGLTIVSQQAHEAADRVNLISFVQPGRAIRHPETT